MSRSLFSAEKGFRIYGENAQTFVDIIKGNGTPTSAEADAAPVGSLYLQDNGQLWQKDTVGTGADKWNRKATTDDLTAIKFRSEKVIAVTSTAAPTTGSTINISATPLGLDESPFLTGTDFDLTSHVIFGFGGTLKIMRVTNIVGNVLTFQDMVDTDDNLSNGDNFIVQYYLPDSSDTQEKQALVQYNNNALAKIADFNWAVADGISLNGSIVDRNGAVLGTDTVQVAVEKLEGDVKDAATLSGLSRGAKNNGTFTGKTIPDSSTTKAALQSLETALEARSVVSNITTTTVIDSVSVDVIKCVEWIVHVFEQATPANMVSFKIMGMHNGTASADATGVDDNLHSKLKLGSNFNLTMAIDLSGSGTNQIMRLTAASTTAGVTVTARRNEVY